MSCICPSYLLREAKITDLGVHLTVQKDVTALDITVYDSWITPIMQIIQSFKRNKAIGGGQENKNSNNFAKKLDKQEDYMASISKETRTFPERTAAILEYYILIKRIWLIFSSRIPDESHRCVISTA